MIGLEGAQCDLGTLAFTSMGFAMVLVGGQITAQALCLYLPVPICSVRAE